MTHGGRNDGLMVGDDRTNYSWGFEGIFGAEKVAVTIEFERVVHVIVFKQLTKSSIFTMV